MPDTKITDDPVVANPVNTDSLPIVAGGVNSRMTFNGLKSYLQASLSFFSGAYADLTGKPTLFSGAYADLTGKPTLGSAAARDTGTTNGTVPLIGSDGKIPASTYNPGSGGGVQNNYAATAAPTTTDDNTKGYAVGSSWLVVGTGEMWRARDVTTNAARWVKVDTADHPGYVAGRRYVPFGMGAPVTGAASVIGTTFFGAGVIKSRITISELHLRYTTAGAAGNYAMAIYANDPLKAAPTGLPLVTSVNGATGTAGPMTVALNSNLSLEPGIYWFAIQQDQTTPIYLSQGAGSTNHLALFGSSGHPIGNGAAAQACGYSINGTFGTWPDVTSATLTEQSSRAPYAGFTVVSVP